MRRVSVAISVIGLWAGAALGTETSVPFINADDVHAQGITGRGVTVAVIDQGVDRAHPGLAGSIAGGGVSIVNGVLTFDGGAALPGVTHGTIVSLVITDETGVAPNTKSCPSGSTARVGHPRKRTYGRASCGPRTVRSVIRLFGSSI